MAQVERLYSSDEPTGYEWVADVEWEDEAYQFEMTRVYKKPSTGELFYAEDSGCSCPSPFEGTEEGDLKPITRMQDWYDHVTARTVYPIPGETYQYPHPTPTSAIDAAHRAATTINTLLAATKENN